MNEGLGINLNQYLLWGFSLSFFFFFSYLLLCAYVLQVLLVVCTFLLLVITLMVRLIWTREICTIYVRCLMVCKIFFCSELPEIPDKSWERRRCWRILANAKHFVFQAHAKQRLNIENNMETSSTENVLMQVNSNSQYVFLQATDCKFW